MYLLEMLAEIRIPAFNYIAQLITYLGQDIPVLVVICAFFWCINKKLAYQIGLSFFASGLLLQNLKITFRIERPWVLNPDFKPVESAVPAATGYSFPSGHTQSATSLYAALALYARKSWQKILCCVIFLLVGLSRMYLGVHTPYDVLTSIFLALAVTCLIHYLFSKPLQSKKGNLVIAIILGICSLASFYHAYTLVSNGVISLENGSDCCSAAGAGLGFAFAWYLERVHIDFTPEKGTLSQKIVRFLVGLFATGVIYIVLKRIVPEGLVFNAVRYCIIVFWIACIYPWIVKKRMQ